MGEGEGEMLPGSGNPFIPVRGGAWMPGKNQAPLG